MIGEALEAVGEARRILDTLDSTKKDLQRWFSEYERYPLISTGRALGKAMNAYGCAYADAERGGYVRNE